MVSVEGEPEQSDDGRDEEIGPDYRAEFELLPSGGSHGFDDEWAALGDVAPWQPVGLSHMPGDRAAFRRASRIAGGVRETLAAVGFERGEVARVRADVDAHGDPSVLLRLSEEAAERLRLLLGSGPDPAQRPAKHRRGRSA